jgi:adenylate cyclase
VANDRLTVVVARGDIEARGLVDGLHRAAGHLPGARHMTVCFADLAGFTRLGEALPPADLRRVASRLAQLAHDVAAAPVRFVKSIGDAVMLVCVVPLLRAVPELVDAAAADGLPRLRVGVASRQRGHARAIGSAVRSTWRAA